MNLRPQNANTFDITSRATGTPSDQNKYDGIFVDQCNVSPVFRIRIQIGSGFRGPLDPDPDLKSGSRGLKKGKKCQIITT